MSTATFDPDTLARLAELGLTAEAAAALITPEAASAVLSGKVSRAELDAGWRAAELEACRTDVVHWLTRWGWTYDPRDMADPYKRFIPFPRQAEYLRWRREQLAVAQSGRTGGGAVNKPREVGVTWCNVADQLHHWLFLPGYAGGFGSRKLELVDSKGNPDCIFEKLRFMLYRLPQWMTPAGFKRHEHDTEGRLTNPSNGASITAEGGDNIGRGGRKLIYDTDEDAFLAHPKAVEAALSATTRCRFRSSTHNGVGTMFYEFIANNRGPVFDFRWQDDPRKNHTQTLPDGRTVYPWYEEQKRTLDPVTLAQEVDRDPTASVEGIAIPGLWVRSAVNLELPGFDDADVWAGFDVGGGTQPTSVLAVRKGPVVHPLRSFTGPNTTAVAFEVKDAAEAQGVQSLCYEHTGVGVSVKGTWESAATKPAFLVRALNTGGRPTKTRWDDGKTAEDKFLNLRAEMWWEVRERFRKTHEYVTEGTPHPPDELVSIPNDPDLVAQLSMPLVERTEGGKLQIESKKKMRSRGVKSPDKADAVVLSFFEGGRSVYDDREVLVLGAGPPVPQPLDARLLGVGASASQANIWDDKYWGD